MKKTRALSLLLCLLLVAGLLLTACQTESGDDGDKSTSGGNSGSAMQSKYVDADGKYSMDGLDTKFDFPQKEFRVCVYNNEKQSTYFSEEIGYNLYDTTDDALNLAVKKRNDLIMEKYGVEVVACPVKDVYTSVYEDVMTGATASYDAAMPFMNGCATLAQNGMLFDLKQFGNYIHLDAPWWDQTANKSLSVANKLYFTTGDISIMQKITSIAITFNKTMYQENCSQYGDLYQLVRDKKWTFDLMYEMGKLVTSDSDGVAGMTYEDTWGLSASNNDAVQYYLASGLSLARKNANDIPELYIGSDENSINVAQKVLETLQRGDEWAMNCQQMNTTGGAPATWTASLAVFGENRALFRTTAFSAVKKLRDYKDADPFGIVPMPLMYEGQDTYFTPSSSLFAYGVCIPKNAVNPEFSAFMLEALSCYAHDTVTYAYYETTLKSRDSQDVESWEMLDQYIFNNIVYDVGVIYGFSGLSSMLGSLMSEKSTNIVSKLDGSRDAINAAIQECVEDYNLDI